MNNSKYSILTTIIILSLTITTDTFANNLSFNKALRGDDRNSSENKRIYAITRDDAKSVDGRETKNQKECDKEGGQVNTKTGKCEITSNDQTNQFSTDPQLNLTENSVTPSISFNAKETFDAMDLVFDFNVSGESSETDADKIVDDFLINKGNINFSLTGQKIYDKFGVYGRVTYSLMSGTEVNVDTTTLDVDSEVLTYELGIGYQFEQQLQLEASYSYFDATNNDSEMESEFVNILDGESALVFGLTIPFEQSDDKPIFLKFQRAKLDGANDAIFRVSVAKSF